jgi:hypothetical protein
MVTAAIARIIGTVGTNPLPKLDWELYWYLLTAPDTYYHYAYNGGTLTDMVTEFLADPTAGAEDFGDLSELVA